jgi:hypothetical protein
MIEVSLFDTASRAALEPTQPPTHWVQVDITPGREAYHSTPSSAGVTECVELYLHPPNTYS